ncbi:MAG: hypothetical protein IT426_19280 [Pirellulales bacterium]|nr:hypothetical protein [Pirellulales bacterium]
MNFRCVFGVCDSVFHGPRPSPPPRPRILFLPTILSAVLLSFSGCGGEPEIPKIPDEEQNILFLLRAYCKFNGEHQRTPKSLDEMKPLLKEFGDPEKIILSPRDGQPYILVGGLDISQAPSGGALPVVAYERNGVNGNRQVIDLRGSIRLLTPEEFKKLKFPPAHKPPA